MANTTYTSRENMIKNLKNVGNALNGPKDRCYQSIQ